MSQPLPNPPWYRRWSVLLAAVIGLAAVAALLGWRGLQQAASPSTTLDAPTTTIPEPTTTRTTVVQPARTTSTTPGLLWREEGSDSVRGQRFRAPRNWRIDWSYDCSDFPGGKGNFKLTGEGAFERVLIQDFDDRASGSQPMTGGGVGRLVITSVCEHWEVRAVVRP